MKKILVVVVAVFSFCAVLSLGRAPAALADGCGQTCRPMGNCVACSFPGCCIGGTNYAVVSQNSTCDGGSPSSFCEQAPVLPICVSFIRLSEDNCTGFVLEAGFRQAAESCF